VVCATGQSIEKALQFIAAEVASWEKDNHCYSCHNNGDGARALMMAGHRPDAGTLAWFDSPQQWDQKTKSPGSSDLKLARMQFFVAAAAAKRAGFSIKDQALIEAERLVLADQGADGCWIVDTGELAGGPVTWGTSLATALVVKSLSEGQGETKQRAVQCIQQRQNDFVVDLAALVMTTPTDTATRKRLLDAQGSDGGWGVRARRPAEVFDTAIALLALEGKNQRASAFLSARQLENGSWPETTRPTGAQSYAHAISTSAWATMALLAAQTHR
jgi:hypothetical protein